MIFEKLVNEGDIYFFLIECYERGVILLGSVIYGYVEKYIFNGVFNYEGVNIVGKYSCFCWLLIWNIGVKWNLD